MVTRDIRQVQSVTRHVLGAVARAFFKVAGAFLGFGVIGAGAVEGTSYFTVSNHLTLLTHIAAAVFGVLLGYAAALTVAVAEAIRGLVDTGKEGVKEVEKIEQGVSQDFGRVVQGVEGDVGKIQHRT